MFMHTPINPLPPIGRRVPRVRHVGAGIEAPARAGLGADLVAVAKERPDSLRPAVVTGMMLLCLRSVSVPARHPAFSSG